LFNRNKLIRAVDNLINFTPKIFWKREFFGKKNFLAMQLAFFVSKLIENFLNVLNFFIFCLENKTNNK